jgi:hypothetical protein
MSGIEVQGLESAASAGRDVHLVNEGKGRQSLDPLNKPAKEKRRHRRLNSDHLISYVHLHDEYGPSEGGMGKTLNLSEGGIKMQTYLSFPVKTTLEMTIAIEDRLIKAKGSLVYLEDGGEEVYDMGISFSEMQPSEKRYLVQFIERSSPQV